MYFPIHKNNNDKSKLMFSTKRTIVAALVSITLIGCGEATTKTETTPAAPTAQDAQ